MSKQKLQAGDVVTIKHTHKKGVFGVTEMEGIFISVKNLSNLEGKDSNFALEVDAVWPYSQVGIYRKMYFTVKEQNYIGNPSEWFIK